jgi:hypothetical protein
MIHIIKGSDNQLEEYIRRNYNDPSDIIIARDSSFIFPHILFRSVVSFVRSVSGDELTGRFLNKYKAPLGLIYKQLTAEFTEDELKQSEFCAARSDSNYAHSQIAKSELIESCAKLIIDYFAIVRFRIVVLQPMALDVNSVDLIKYLYHIYNDKAPDFILAYNPNWGDDEYDPLTGISHYFGHDTITFLESFVYAFENAASQLTDLTIHTDTNEEVIPGASFQTNINADPEEYQAFELLQNNTHFDRSEAELIINVIRKLFRMFDFYNTVFMGLKAREKLFNQLTNRERADLLHLIGLSAHIRHFFTQDNQPLADFLKEIFQEALQYEDRYRQRLALLYRLTVTHSRRKNDVAEALKFIEQAQSEKSAGNSKKDVLGVAWMLNIHSYVRMKEGKIEEAIQLHEDSYYSVAELNAEDYGICKKELEFTKAVLAENLATLNARVKNYTAMKRWYEIETSFSSQWSYLQASAKAEWQSFYYQQNLLSDAKQNAKDGLLLSQKSFNYVLEYYFTLSLAQISSRSGALNDAIRYSESCLVFCNKIGHSYPEITTFKLLVSTIHLYLIAGNTQKALLLFEYAQQHQLIKSSADKIKIAALRAHLFVLEKENDKADTSINDAIEIALEEARSDLIFSILLSAAGICMLSDRTAEAQTAYAKASELLEIEISGEVFKPSYEELADLHLGYAITGVNSLSHLTDAVRFFALALPTYTQIWWRLKNLLQELKKLSKADYQKIQTATGHSLNEICKAAVQREDCKPFLNPHQLIVT